MQQAAVAGITSNDVGHVTAMVQVRLGVCARVCLAVRELDACMLTEREREAAGFASEKAATKGCIDAGNVPLCTPQEWQSVQIVRQSCIPVSLCTYRKWQPQSGCMTWRQASQLTFSAL